MEVMEAMETKENIYQQARNIYYHTGTDEGLLEARQLFEQVRDYKNSESFLEKCDELLKYRVGNTVTYGNYNGQPIQWNVIAENGKMRLLLTSKNVAYRQFHPERENVSWSSCDLRHWMNGEFFHNAFTQAERMPIVGARRANEPNLVWSTQCGPDTFDKIFALSHRELVQYLPDAKSRAIGEWWWLRTLGHNVLTASCVYFDGTEYDIGLNIISQNMGVRPAMWLMLRR